MGHSDRTHVFRNKSYCRDAISAIADMCLAACKVSPVARLLNVSRLNLAVGIKYKLRATICQLINVPTFLCQTELLLASNTRCFQINFTFDIQLILYRCIDRFKANIR